jgi:para-aminobenzoate synthetase/4-amino-4-deoxychorismate lyase
MLWDGEYFLLREHLERLVASAEYVDFEFDREKVISHLQEATRGFTVGIRYRIRLLLGGSGEISLTSSLIEADPEFCSIVVASERVCSQDLFLRHKTTHRALYDRVYQELVAREFQDALFLNERDEMAEGAIHTIVVEKDGLWLTPPLSTGVLPGVYRRHLLETHAEMREGVLTLESFRSADRIFICNSVRGLREVGSIRCGDEVLFSRAAVRVDLTGREHGAPSR